MSVIKNGGAFQTFPDVNGNPFISINRDGSIFTQSVTFADGTSQTTASSSGLLSQTTNLTSAQIKTLHGSPTTIITAVPGYGIIPVSATLIYTPGTTAYTGASGTLSTIYTSGNSTTLGTTQANFITQSITGLTSSFSVLPDSNAGTNTSNLGAKGLAIQLFKAASGEFATGDGTLQVQALYYLVPMA
jgi:hypothetical protein